MSDGIERINRDLAIKENLDPMGTKWGITTRKGYSLYLIGKVNDEGRVALPQTYPKFEGMGDMSGAFTSPARAEEAIRVYLLKAWDKYGMDQKLAPGKERAKAQKVEDATVKSE